MAEEEAKDLDPSGLLDEQVEISGQSRQLVALSSLDELRQIRDRHDIQEVVVVAIQPPAPPPLPDGTYYAQAIGSLLQTNMMDETEARKQLMTNAKDKLMKILRERMTNMVMVLAQLDPRYVRKIVCAKFPKARDLSAEDFQTIMDEITQEFKQFNSCLICHEDECDAAQMVAPCSKCKDIRFHISCLSVWLIEHAVCPICRKEAIDLFRESQSIGDTTGRVDEV